MKRINHSQKVSILTAAGLGLGVSVICGVLLGMLLTTLIAGEKVGENAVVIGLPAILFLAVCAGCITAGRVGEGRTVILCGITAVSFLGVLMSFGIVLFDVTGAGGLINTTAVLISTMFTTALLKTRRTQRHSR